MALEDLKNIAAAIKAQTRVGGNTANIIGDLFEKMLDLFLLSTTITQSTGTDPAKVMSQKAVTQLVVSIQNAIDNINKYIKTDTTVQGQEKVYLQISGAYHDVARIGTDCFGNAYIEYLDADQVSTKWNIASKELIATIMNKDSAVGLNRLFEKLAFNVSTSKTLTDIGEVFFNSGSQTLELKMTNDVTLQIGQEVLRKVKNDSGAVIGNGKLVYVSGGLGANALVKLATTDDANAAQRTFGMATQDITVGGTGFVTLLGDVNGLNTSGITEGAELWLGQNGNYTTTEPTGATPKIYIGRCLRSHATQGVIGVSIRPIPRMHKLSGVSGTPTTTGQVYRYNATTSCFELYDLNLLATKDELAQVSADLKQKQFSSPESYYDYLNSNNAIVILDCFYRIIQTINNNDSVVSVNTANINTNANNIANANLATLKKQFSSPESYYDYCIENYSIIIYDCFYRKLDFSIEQNNNADYEYSNPAYVFDIESSSRWGREYATSIYPEGIVGENVDANIDDYRKKVLKVFKSTWSDSVLSPAIITSIFNYALKVNNKQDILLSTTVYRANRNNAKSKLIIVLAIGDSLTDASVSYPDGSYNGGWGWPSCIKEISVKDNVDIGNINIINVGTRNNTGSNLSYKGSSHPIRSFSEGRSGWTTYGYANYPLYVRVNGAATPADGVNFMGYKGMYYLCGLATKTPNYSGSSQGQTWVDCPTLSDSEDATIQSYLLAICDTPVGRYKPNYCSILWEALKIYTDFIGTGNYVQSTSDAIMEDYLLNPTTGKFILPDNPFYDYEKASSWTAGNYNYDIAFSVEKYLSQYKTLSDSDGTTRLTVGSTAGTRVSNASSYDVCTPTHIIMGLGTNDYWLSVANANYIGMKLLNACKFNSTVKVGWFIKRDNTVLNQSTWMDKGLFMTGVNTRFYQVNKSYMNSIGTLSLSNQLFYLPVYYTHCVCGSYATRLCEDGELKNDYQISSDDKTHGDIYGYYSIAQQCLAWIYYTLQ